ncbi:MAG: CusA/CzcA family heavy metal efflux RND transporter [Candidatus Dadabacteria bacterium]|jgi:Cu(I)/Ag(I) efflux system membrane protein CusA/SilA|nr:CusA/CzcA family heavy metal efflux RND transporter [Candidatus Dadabacteria bacterium]MCZ6638842.1 CusA/CzcA family heavy metal efflux RND transporter [Candidatus Dadabacteria bacterium]MCZ6685265.1 CusA/CzcA family heavy metal efflux RND transporter [Candidatus Dadabacteria bacterium]MCZ6791593.1 CusA/CzcA family heavy metal efflux RND transporter [Candidatus Dadabacteria bacterium]MCZ6865081.1 CusA/CzcA family heavy metal efflux RND transporter [Candidatus Dadabacteria bacterium]
MIEKIIEYSAKNQFLTITMIFFLAAWGLWAMRNTPLDAIPDLSDVQVIVFTEWPGRSPDIIEDQITYPIITTMISAPQVKFVRGQSFFGLSFVYVIFEDGTDLYWARSRILEYMNQVSGKLPEGVTPTLGPDATGVGWVFQYALVDETGENDLAELRTFQDWYLRYWLESVPGVAEVASVGGFEKQYQVEIDPNKLIAYKIPLADVITAIRRSNNDVGGRVVEFAATEYFVRGRGYIKSVEDIEMIPLRTSAQGTPVYIRDVANVQLGPDMRRGLAELDGKGETVGGIVVMRYGGNALKVIEGVKQKLEEIKPSLPKGVEIVTTYDRSELILSAVGTLKQKLLEEGLIVSIIIILFLFHFRSALTPILTIPLAVLMAFIPLYYMNLSSNIMSLGGIAIAIGVMVDASIVLVENVHKRLEKWQDGGEKGSRSEVVIDAMKEVGKPIFFAILVITVSFLPVFTLEAQEGRLFKPLAFTKTFSLLFSAILAITLTPALIVLLIKGKVRSEDKNPVSRALIWFYNPFVIFALRFRKTVIFSAIAVLLLTLIPFSRLGSEFMPPLNEGTILFMPTAVPGMSITEAAKILQTQDKMLMQFPEVERVFGKIGRSSSALDSAPLSMVETIVTLKPKEEWREGITWDKLLAEMNQAMKFPGMANIFWMPIQTRTEMLSTGFRSNLGIKIFGPDLNKIEEIGIQIETLLSELPGTRSAFAERATGGYFIDFDIDRSLAAKYGFTVGDVEDIIETAIGGKNISHTVEGQERYPINVRYQRGFRSDIEELKRVLVSTPGGAQVPISLLADISFTTGPPQIRNENGQIVGYVFVDVQGKDYEGYVEKAKEVISERLDLPPGYFLEWAGQYEYLQRVRNKLKIMIPLTLALIFLLLYINFRSVIETIIILLSVPFALVGSIWLLYLLNYNLSVAVWVGMIALAGLAAQTGVMMIIYLDAEHDRWKSEGKLRSLEDLKELIIEGAVKRVRPKMMTVMSTTMGLLPLMWSIGTGADMMKRIAAPMIGGLITSTVLTLVIIPVVYLIWKGRGLEVNNNNKKV